MKKKLFISVFAFTMAVLSAQRFGYVDTEYVLDNLPEYERAQQRLTQQAEAWQNEISGKKEILEQKKLSLENERILLTEEQLTDKETEIEELKTEIEELQEKRYGPDGDLIRARRNLVKPIQDRVWNAVKAVAERRNYNFVFDKGNGDVVLIYTDPKFDISEEVLRKLKPEKENNRNNRKSNAKSRRK